MNSLSIVVPCFNEAENLPLLINKFDQITRGKNNIEIIFVNNGSTDNSLDVFERELSKKENSNLRLVSLPVNIGYGDGILSGLEVATHNVLSWTHADLQTDPHDAIACFELLKGLNNPAIVIKGKRTNRRFLELFFTLGMQWFVFIIHGHHINDINAQPKVFSRDFYVSHIKDRAPKDFSLDLYLLLVAKRHSFQIMEIPVLFARRQHGVAKGGSGGSWQSRVNLIKRTYKYILQIKRQ